MGTVTPGGPDGALTVGEQFAFIERWNAAAVARGRQAVEAHEWRAFHARERLRDERRRQARKPRDGTAKSAAHATR